MRKSILTHTLELEKEEFISKAIDIFNEIYPQKELDQKNINEKQAQLRSRLVNLINQSLETESATKTREITILLADLRGFTAMAENYSPTIVIEVLNRFFSRMSEVIVTQHDGFIDKFMGDSIMVLFGSLETKADDLERALSCGIHMQIAMDEINQQNESLNMPELYMGIGINTGIVVTGKVGSELHNEYTVIGDEVNLASRIEAYSLRGQILIGENTYQLAKDYIETNDPIQVFVKGKKERVNLYELLSIKKPTSLLVPRREVRKSPRVNVKMPFAYQRVVDKKVLPEIYNGEIVDISYNGFLCEIKEPLKTLSEIKFTLALSILGGESSDIYARVVKIIKLDGKYQAGIEFTSINIHAKDSIKSFIDRIIQGV